jgi:molecular chaperone GrpE
VAEPKREEEKVIPIDARRAETDDGAPQNQGPRDPSQTELPPANEAALAAEIEKLKAEREELTQTMIRRQADFENFRKRTERDRHEEGRRGVERLIMDLVPVLDAFDRAIEAHEAPGYDDFRKGVNLIRKQFWDTLAKHGVQRVDATGKMFDPHLHQAIERVESAEVPDGSVVAVFQDGYMFHGRVLRPAIVSVAVHPSEGDGSSAAGEN